MSISRKIAAPNAIVLISDIHGGMPPDLMQGSLIAATSSCIAVGCMSDSNGPTEITLGSGQDVGSRDNPAFEGELETPSKVVAVRTVLHETILQAPVPRPRTKVRVWVNHPTEPDRVFIGVA